MRMPVVDVGGNQMDVISRLLKDRILLLGQQVRARRRKTRLESDSVWLAIFPTAAFRSAGFGYLKTKTKKMG